MALTQVSSAGIKNAEVKTEDILDANITTAKVADNAITGAKVSDNLDIPDNNKIRFGTGNDLEIFHNGSNTLIDNNTGTLSINTASNEIQINKGTSEYMGRFITDGAVELYYDGTKKFETTSTGTNTVGIHIDDGANHDGDVNFYGANYNIFWDKSANALKFTDNSKAIFGDHSGTGDLHIYHNGTDSFIVNNTNWLNLNSDKISLGNAANNEAYLKALANGAVELYYDDTKKFETTSGGVKVTGLLMLRKTYILEIIKNYI